MEETKRDITFQRLVDAFQLNKPGASPFDPDLLDRQYEGASHGEKVSIAFLLNVYNPTHPWKAGKFDLMDALGLWDEQKKAAFVKWAASPFWP